MGEKWLGLQLLKEAQQKKRGNFAVCREPEEKNLERLPTKNRATEGTGPQKAR